MRAPLSVNGLVLLVVTDSLQIHRAWAIDAAGGEVAWSTERPEVNGSLPGDPAYLDGNLVVPYASYTSSNHGGVATVSASTGAVVDEGAERAPTWAVAVVGGELVVVKERGETPTSDPDRNVADGPCDATIHGTDGPRTPYTFVGRDLAWSDRLGARGFADCDPATGRYASDWEARFGRSFGTAVAVGDDDVAYLDDQGVVTVLDSSTGTFLWDAGVGAAYRTTPAYAAGSLFVTTADQRLVVLNGATGAQRWEAAIAGPVELVATSVTVAGDVVYVANAETGTIQAFARGGCGAATCPALATIEVGGPLDTAPIVDDGRLVVGTADGRLIAYGLEG